MLSCVINWKSTSGGQLFTCKAMQEKSTYEELEALIKRLEKELANALAKVVELTKPYS